MPKTFRWIALLALAFAIQAWLYVFADGGFALFRFHSIGANTISPGLAERFRQLIFLLNYAVAVTLALAMPLSKSKIMRFVLAPLLWLAMTFELIYTQTAGRPPTFSDVFALNMAAFTNVGDAVTEFGGRAIAPILWALSLMILPLILMRLVKRAKLIRPILVLGFAYLTIAYGAILYLRGEPAVVGFPKGYNYLLATAWLAPATWPQPPMAHPQVQNSVGNFQKIVVLIDESVWGPALEGISLPKDRSVVELRKSFSTGNCSAASNFYLRKAVRIDGQIYPTTSLFELAKSKGFVTTYIDTQGVLRDPTTRNYFDAHELSFVDRKEELDIQYLPQDRDTQALSMVRQVLKRPGKDFLIVNKHGAHFPYEANLPQDMRSSDRFSNYKNAVELHSKRFLKEISEIMRHDTVAFYTSDHGQYVAGPATHCNSGDQARRQEWEVPFAVLTANTRVLERVRKQINHRGEMPLTHTEFTESVREALGFGFSGVGSFFELKPMPVENSGLCLNFGPPLGFFGREPSCKSFMDSP